MLVSAAEARYGKEAAGVLPILRDSIKGRSEDYFVNRIGAQRPADLLAGIKQLATELQVLLRRPYLICLDDLHWCDDDELRQLAQFATALPSSIGLVCSFTASNAEQKQRLHGAFNGVGNPKIWQVNGLSETDIAYLLARAEVDPDLAPQVHKATDGYALHVVDAIQLLKDGARPTDLALLGRDEILTRNTEAQLRSLDPGHQSSVRRLAGFDYPISDQRAQTALSLNAVDWDVLKSRLIDVGIFLHRPDLDWFHELRRVVIWSRMNDEAKKEVAQLTASTIISSDLVRTSDVLTLATHLKDAASSLAHDLELGSILDISVAELTVAASILEIAELRSTDQSGRFVHVDWALLHSRSFAPSALVGDLIDALALLADKKLIICASDDNGAVATPYWNSRQGLLVAARAYQEFGRLFHPGLATYIFESLRVEVGRFRWSSHSVGRGSVRRLSQTAQQLGTVNPDGSRHFGRRDRPALLLRAHYGDLSWSAAITYDTSASADQAAEQLSGTTRLVGHTRLAVESVFKHPLPLIPARRFVRALELILGEDLDNAYSRGKLSKGKPAASATAEQMLDRVKLRNLIRENCTDVERECLDLDEDEGLIYEEISNDGGTRTLVIARVEGMVGAREVSGLLQLDRGPYRFIRLAAELNLQPSERIRTVHTHWGRVSDNHLADELEQITLNANDFNGAQDRLLVRDDAEWLQPELERAATTELELARELAAAFPDSTAIQPKPTQTFIRIVNRERSEWDFEGVGVEAYTFEATSQPSVIVIRSSTAVAETPTDWDSVPDWITGHAKFEAGSLRTLTTGGLGIIAERLGYYEGEIDFREFRPSWLALRQPSMDELQTGSASDGVDLT